jgi:hypothetical protein
VLMFVQRTWDTGRNDGRDGDVRYETSQWHKIGDNPKWLVAYDMKRFGTILPVGCLIDVVIKF